MYNLKLTYCLCTLLLFSGCRQAGTKNNESDAENDSIFESAELESELSDVYHRFPSPDEMFRVLTETNLTFSHNLTNNPANVQDYLSSKSQALNLGVYIADFAYISVFKRFNDSPKYFEAIYKLCDNLRISSAFDYTIMKRIENNLSNPDSLKTISDLAFNSLNSYLVSNRNEKSFALISIGGFVEFIYLSFRLSESYSEGNILVQHIADQKYVLENIVAFANQFADDEDVKSSLKILEPIADIYNKIDIVPEETKVTKNAEGKLIIEGGDKLEISKELYDDLQLVITDARNRIIKN